MSLYCTKQDKFEKIINETICHVFNKVASASQFSFQGIVLSFLGVVKYRLIL